MRVVSVCPTYPPRALTCGVGDYTRCLDEELARQDVDVSVVCAGGYRGSPSPVRVTSIATRWSARDALRFVRSVAGRADVVHLQYTPDLYGGGAFWLAPLLLRLRPRRRPASVVTCHTLTGRRLASRVAAVAVLWTPDAVISASEEVTAMVRRRLSRLPGRLTEIPIGANILPATATDGPAARQDIGLPVADRLVAHFGLVYPGKGLETLLAALAEIRRGGRRLHLVVLGDVRPEDEAYLARLRGLAASSGIEDAVTWAGRRSSAEVARILGVCDAYVVPFDDGASTRRGTLIAGLAHGLPVITTMPRHASAYLADGEGVALVPRRDPQALAACLCRLLDAPDEAARLRTGARRLAERFAWPAIARRTREVYEAAVAR